MNVSTQVRSGRRTRGMALVAALAYGVVVTLLIASGLYLSMGFRSQVWAEARSEAAAELADAGINNELATIATGVGATIFSPPTVTPGETMVYPKEGHVVYGRKGLISGVDGNYWVCTTMNEWWRSKTTPTVWDGQTSPYWITASAYVRGSWRRATVRVQKRSVFGQYAFYADGQYGVLDDIVTADATASVTVTGMGGTNGQVKLATGSVLSLGNVLNANRANTSGAQFPNSVVRVGSTLSTQPGPKSFDRTVDSMKKVFGIVAADDASAGLALLARSANSTGVYTYKLAAGSATLAPANCVKTSLLGNALENYNILNILLPTKACWDNCNVKPGTGAKVKTLIFEPGDYYLNDVNLRYDASTELVIDPMALASGGTPGPVRFWFYDVNLVGLGGSNHINIPIVMTKAVGASAPDPSMFRIYYGKDGSSLTFNRPSNVKDYAGANLTGDFNYYVGIYSITKPTNIYGLITNLLWYGSKVSLAGTAGATGGKVVVNGSVIADRIGFSGPCAINLVASSDASDPAFGASVLGSYLDGK